MDKLFSEFSKLKIVVVGDLILDHYIWGEVTRISPEAPVPVVRVARDTYSPGGAANVAYNLAALGIKTEVIGYLGVDEAGFRLRALLQDKGIATDSCISDVTAATIVKTRVVARSQQVCRIDREPERATYHLDAENGFREGLIRISAGADAVIISDYAKGIVTQGVVDDLVGVGKAQGRLVAMDPKPSRKLNLNGTGLLTPNWAEAVQLAGIIDPVRFDEDTLREVCANIHSRFDVEVLLITLGAHGMALCHKGRVSEVLPTKAREVFDVSGAGDTVIATVTAALASGAAPIDAARLANFAAGIVVSKMGTATASLSELSRAVSLSEDQTANDDGRV